MSDVPTASSLQRLLDAQRAAHLLEGPPSAELRIDRLDRAIGWLVDQEQAVVAALEEDFGRRSPVLTRLGEIAVVIAGFKHARERVTEWMRIEERAPNPPLDQFGARAYVQYQPLGVVGIIAPWNTPVRLIFQPLCGVLAAGNRAMVKPSELTPAVASLITETLPSVFAPEEVAVVTGGPEVAEAFSALAFDHLVFTGGEAVARRVMASAARNLVPVTLELGGKCPVIVGSGGPGGVSANRIATGKLTNAGQACIAPDYLLVPQDDVDSWAAELERAFSSQAPTLLGNPDYTAIINERHAERLRGLVADAREHSRAVIEVNPAEEQLVGTTTIAPTLVLDPDLDAAVMGEEIFGPVLPILGYQDLDEAIAYVNGRARPLALYFIGEDETERERVLERTVSGGVTVGDVMAHTVQDDLPFGGVGASGTGQYRGVHGFKRFSHARSVFVQADLDLVGLAGLRPPFDDRVEGYLQAQIQRPVSDEPPSHPLLERIPELCAADGEWGLSARGWNGTLRVGIGDSILDVALTDGRITEATPGIGTLDAGVPGNVSYRASSEVWEQMLAPVPPPPFHDAFSAQLEGAELAGHVDSSRQYYPAVRRLVELLRADGAE